MIAGPVYRGATMKRVAVTEVTPADTDSRILEVALAAARETRSSLFGHSITRSDSAPSVVVVTMHTD